MDVHCYCDPATRTADVRGVTFHDVPSVRIRRLATRRFSHPVERASFALAATRVLDRDRRLFDVVDVRQTAALRGDVLQVHGVHAAMQKRWASEAGRTFRAARVRAAIAPVVRPQLGVDRAIQRLQLRGRRFLRVIAVTPQVRDDLIRVHGVPPGSIDVVAPPIDLNRIVGAKAGDTRDRFGIRDEEALVLFVGHDFQRKGLDRLVEALADVPETHLVVVGDGDRSAATRSMERTELARRVHFAGRVDEPERYYAAADVLVLPTRSDPWGIPLIEAMGAGIPVITTSMAGAARVVASSEAGIVLSDDSIGTLRDGIRGLVQDPELRRRMGERGRAAAARFGAESHAAAVLATYDRALGDADPRRH